MLASDICKLLIMNDKTVIVNIINNMELKGKAYNVLKLWNVNNKHYNAYYEANLTCLLCDVNLTSFREDLLKAAALQDMHKIVGVITRAIYSKYYRKEIASMSRIISKECREVDVFDYKSDKDFKDEESEWLEIILGNSKYVELLEKIIESKKGFKQRIILRKALLEGIRRVDIEMEFNISDRHIGRYIKEAKEELAAAVISES